VKGTDVWYGSGRVCGEVEFGKTNNGGNEACSFRIDVGVGGKPTFVRVNVYGGNVEVIRRRNVVENDYVIVSGELMTRQSEGRSLTEVRCGSIVIASGDEAEDARGTNRWFGSGNVAGKIDYGSTSTGEDACSFKVAIERHHSSIYLRVNVFDDVVDRVRVNNVDVGDYILMSGEIMNRKTQDKWLSEIRCLDVVMIRRGRSAKECKE